VQAQPLLSSEQVGALGGQALLSGVLLQVPPLQLSLVQAMPSLQSVSLQQALQPSAQHLVPGPHSFGEHLPSTHAAVWQVPTWQSEACIHWAVARQPFAGSHENPGEHAEASAACPQVPCVQESLVHFTPSSQSAAEQQVPQLAAALSAVGQQLRPAPHKPECWHLLAEHESLVHGS